MAEKVPAYLEILLHAWGRAFDAGIGFNKTAAGFDMATPGYPEESHSDEQEVEKLGRFICELGNTGLIRAIEARYRKRKHDGSHLNRRESAWYCSCSKKQYVEYLEFAIGKLDRRMNE